MTKGKILINDEESEVTGKKIRVEFIKGHQDNPKVNAIYVVKGVLDDVPKLPALSGDTDDEEREEFSRPPEKAAAAAEEPVTPTASSRRKKDHSTPKIADPYAGDDTSTLLPIFVAVAAFIPLLFCLCKL